MAAAVEGQGRLVEVEPTAVVADQRRPVGEEKTFRPYDPEQVLLMAPVLSEWVPEGHLARFVSDLVESGVLDLAAIYGSYEEERGYPPYDPRLMLKLIVYGYAIGVVSSRGLERASYEEVAVRMLCADQHPDHRSIARFRKRHLEALGELFVQSPTGTRAANSTARDPVAAARAVFDASTRYHNPVHAAAWSDPDIDTSYENVRALVLAGLTPGDHRRVHDPPRRFSKDKPMGCPGPDDYGTLADETATKRPRPDRIRLARPPRHAQHRRLAAGHLHLGRT